MGGSGGGGAEGRSGRAQRLRRALVRAAAFVSLLGLLFIGVAFVQVWSASRDDGARDADAIVVLGAAQWDGRPSPVLEARLVHALDLYRAGYADRIVTTGSKQEGDRFTEAFAGLTYLLDRGVPESAIVVVTDGTNTYESLAATQAALVAAGVGTEVVLVSDPYHALRAIEIAREVGLAATFSPTELDSSFRQLARETAGVALGRLVGYRRVSNLSR